MVLKRIRAGRLVRVGGGAAIVIGVARAAAAQSALAQGAYISISAIADVKRFSGDPATNVLDGQSFGIGAACGSSLTARWDVEVAVDASRDSANSQSRVVTVRREAITLQSRTRNQALSVATLLRFHAARLGRVQIGYLGGLSFLRLQRRFDTLAPAETPAALVPRPSETVSYGVAPTVGLDALVAITDHLHVVLAFHASGFNFDGLSGVLLRPQIGARWAF